MAVERCELAPGLTISRVLTGMWQVADMERDGRRLDLDAAAADMVPYVEAGLTTFDMADHYGSAELIAGRLRRSGRDDVQFLTKWVPSPGPVTRSDVRRAVRHSLDRLQMDRLDLLQFHTWAYDDPTWLDCLFWLQELQEEGLIRYLGLTNFDAPHLQIALESGLSIVSNQVCYSLLDRRAAGAMTALCVKYGVKLLAYGTLAGGFLTERWLGQGEPRPDVLKTQSQMKYARFIEAAGGWEPFQHLLETVRSIAEAHGVSMANIATRYVLEQPAVGGVIIGARLSQSQHVVDNLNLFDFELSDSSRAALTDAAEELGRIPGDCGDEYRRAPFLTASGDLRDHLDAMPVPFAVHADSRGRPTVSTGTHWEELAGYCRAKRMGARVLVSGTTATHGDRLIGGPDAGAQLHFIIDKIEGALRSLGCGLGDIVRTRLYVQHAADCEAVSRVHGARFAGIDPTNTLIQADLIGDGYLVEMEAEAVDSNG